ncbi:DUF938 domain-containing protein [Candidatus Spongiihabitans sp.]|uniref:DUF938 domain-containing protein n=1 Tax=Candidatus Spongiihabitans sp. TaxID=3101308 RepID=UPI003C702851
MKPFSQACENNKQPILAVLKNYFANASGILEIGSGTGQHAVFFAENLPGLFWQTSDQAPFHRGINLWIDDVAFDNIGKPIALDVRQKEQWPANIVNKQEHGVRFSGVKFDGVFSANTAHIMSWDAVVEMFRGVGCLLMDNGLFILYGPFNRNGEFTSPSNEKFHGGLLRQDPQMGIRDDRAIVALANRNKLSLIDDVAMPANNRILVFSKCFYKTSVKSAI